MSTLNVVPRVAVFDLAPLFADGALDLTAWTAESGVVRLRGFDIYAYTNSPGAVEYLKVYLDEGSSNTTVIQHLDLDLPISIVPLYTSDDATPVHYMPSWSPLGRYGVRAEYRRCLAFPVATKLRAATSPMAIIGGGTCTVYWEPLK